MRAGIRKWGNSLALRIPKSLAAEAELEPNALVELSLVDGKLVVLRVAEPEVTLEQLLAGVSEQNLHREANAGRAVGGEAW
jgi:antitoxin MazE